MLKESKRDADAAQGKICARCGARMNVLTTIAPLLDDPGLIGYECPKCGYVTSDLAYPGGVGRTG